MSCLAIFPRTPATSMPVGVSELPCVGSFNAAEAWPERAMPSGRLEPLPDTAVDFNEMVSLLDFA